MNIAIPHNLILPKYFRIVKGAECQKRAHGWAGQAFLLLYYFLFVFRPRRPLAQKILGRSPRRRRAGNQAGKKERGLGEGIFARLFSVENGLRWKAFPPSRLMRDIKAKQFSNPFKRKRVARQIQKIERKLFCFARRVSAGGNAGAGFQIIRAIFARKRFELRSAIATNLNIADFASSLFARSP